MGKLGKVLWISLIISIIILYFIGVSYISNVTAMKEKVLTSQVTLYISQKKDLKNEKKRLLSFQEYLLSEFAAQKEQEKKIRASLQSEQSKIEEEKKRQAQRKTQQTRVEELRKQNEENRLEELRRLEEIRQKRKKRRRSRAS